MHASKGQWPFKLGVIASAALMAMSAHADFSADSGVVPLATGQFITPTAVGGAIQQFLNPGLPAYPNFIAGEAVRSQLSPDHLRWPEFDRQR